jgi:hypothetical protein
MRNLASVRSPARPRSGYAQRLDRRKPLIIDGPFAETKEALWSGAIAGQRQSRSPTRSRRDSRNDPKPGEKHEWS